MIEYDIKNGLNNKGCFVCNIVQRKMNERLKWFMLENYHDISTLEELNKNPYICEKHKKSLIKMNNILSVTFEFLIKRDIELFQSLLKVNGRKLQKEIEKTDFSVCKFCKEETEFEKLILEMFVKMLDNEENKQLYKNSEGLCRKHLMQCLKIIGKNDEKSIFLIQDVVERLSYTKKSLEQFFHKSDYRFSNEQKGKEQNAWIEALNFYSNNKK